VEAGNADAVVALEDLAAELVRPDKYRLYQAVLDTNIAGLIKVARGVLLNEVQKVARGVLEPRDLGTAATDDRDKYLLGDIFHANPQVTPGASELTYFGLNLCGLIKSGANNCDPDANKGYRDFAARVQWRRRMLMVASNDGQLHFFDAGTRANISFDAGDTDAETVDVFTDGEGVELFSYMPRLTLPAVREQVLQNNHIYTVDSSTSISDVFIDPQHTGTPTVADREWRSVLVAGVREGGDIYKTVAVVDDFRSGYFALDITQPDILEIKDDGTYGPVNSNLAENTTDLPSCLDFDYSSGVQSVQSAGTGDDNVPCKYPFPAELWTFEDVVYEGDRAFLVDEDGNGKHDLGETWSRPSVGLVKVFDPGQSKNITKHVAIFGGGLDPLLPEGTGRGNFLYMVDMETGQPIYKQVLDGSAAADPAVLDTDRDGILDVVYIGTNTGKLYKVDLTTTALLQNGFKLNNYILDGASYGGGDVVISRIRSTDWVPEVILAAFDSAPIYFAPTIFPIPELGAFGVAVGTGNREDLWEAGSSQEGRFYVFVDDDTLHDDTNLPTSDISLLEHIAWDADPLVDPPTDDYLVKPEDGMKGGWVMTFPDSHRLIAEPFLVSGFLSFSMFEPIVFLPSDVSSSSSSGSPSGDPPDATAVCARTGITRLFVVNARNSDPVGRLSGSNAGVSDPEIDGEVVSGGGGLGEDDTATTGDLEARDRYHRIGEYTTTPFLTQSTKNSPTDSTDGFTLDDLAQEFQAGVADSLKSVYPRGSRFNDAFSYFLNVEGASTSLKVVARIPKAIFPADWREAQ